jgi:hypothetical protein
MRTFTCTAIINAKDAEEANEILRAALDLEGLDFLFDLAEE